MAVMKRLRHVGMVQRGPIAGRDGRAYVLEMLRVAKITSAVLIGAAFLGLMGIYVVAFINGAG
jgi:hypothetical protein